ncbi:hypothetical protein LPIBR_10250 [Lacticaseibacillus paracasei]|nr:hypothetical protein LPIBR_10250 [Lacticaseibacillus paracasei]
MLCLIGAELDLLELLADLDPQPANTKVAAKATVKPTNNFECFITFPSNT